MEPFREFLESEQFSQAIDALIQELASNFIYRKKVARESIAKGKTPPKIRGVKGRFEVDTEFREIYRDFFMQIHSHSFDLWKQAILSLYGEKFSDVELLGKITLSNPDNPKYYEESIQYFEALQKFGYERLFQESGREKKFIESDPKMLQIHFRADKIISQADHDYLDAYLDRQEEKQKK